MWEKERPGRHQEGPGPCSWPCRDEEWPSAQLGPGYLRHLLGMRWQGGRARSVPSLQCGEAHACCPFHPQLLGPSCLPLWPAPPCCGGRWGWGSWHSPAMCPPTRSAASSLGLVQCVSRTCPVPAQDTTGCPLCSRVAMVGGRPDEGQEERGPGCRDWGRLPGGGSTQEWAW